MGKEKNTKQWPLANLHYLHQKGKLLLDPTYQRGAVWTLPQKRLFIDSLLTDIDIPKLYFRKKQGGPYEYEVVDGQQRLRAIFAYFDDQFALGDDTDILEGKPVKYLKFSQLHTDVQMKLRETSLDVVVLTTDWTDEDVEDMFTRLQNGTPLNAAEKRRALPSKMRFVVDELSHHKVFAELCSYGDKRFAHEDSAAKLLHLFLNGELTDIRHSSIRETYEDNPDITAKHTAVVRLTKALNFIAKAFSKTASPSFKKFAIITVGYLVGEMLDEYTLADYPKEFATAYLEFELRRLQNEQDVQESQKDRKLAEYTEAARADRIQDLKFRHATLHAHILRAIPELELKDPIRGFSDEQRRIVYWRDKGICQNPKCGKLCDESQYHVDHVKPHAKGGKTSIANAQLLCIDCNLAKGAKH